MNAETRRPYRGVNVVLLAIEAQAHGYPLQPLAHLPPGRRSWADRCARASTARRSCSGSCARSTPRRSRRHEPDLPERVIPLLRCFTVFNIAQIDGLPPAHGRSRRQACRAWSGDEAAELLIDASGATSAHGGFKAFYPPGSDYIQLPPRTAFADRVGLLRHDAARAGALDGAPVPAATGSSAGASATRRTRPRS